MGESIEQELRAFFAAHAPEVVAAYLFGSAARGTDSERSDVDVAVLYAHVPQAWSRALDLEGELERVLGREVDVVVLDSAPVDLVHEVLRDGRLVAERDRARRIGFEVKARNDYFDLLPLLEQYRRMRSAS